MHALTAYYAAAQAPFEQVLKARGYSQAEIGTHAGLADTALMLAVDPSLVRLDKLVQAPKDRQSLGVYGDPARSTAELGHLGTQFVVEKSVQTIRDMTR